MPENSEGVAAECEVEAHVTVNCCEASVSNEQELTAKDHRRVASVSVIISQSVTKKRARTS